MCSNFWIFISFFFAFAFAFAFYFYAIHGTKVIDIIHLYCYEHQYVTRSLCIYWFQFMYIYHNIQHFIFFSVRTRLKIITKIVVICHQRVNMDLFYGLFNNKISLMIIIKWYKIKYMFILLFLFLLILMWKMLHVLTFYRSVISMIQV